MSILNKIKSVEGDYTSSKNFASIVGPIHFFDKDGQLSSSWKGYVKEKDNNHPIKYYLNKQMDSQGFGWIDIKDIPKNRESIKLHKVYFPEAGGSGTDAIVLGRPFYGEPNSVCSQTYLVVGYDPNKHNFTAKECEHIIVYMRTRFLRYLVSIKKTTQHNPSNVFQFVPLQDWSKPWTDAELYAKYNLSSDEIAYIESMIKPMADDALFSTEETLDPEFGNFNLKEYGVKPGDTITYTPTEMEVTVLEDNKVSYGGEEYTLAEFTAENMPRNKRSISGVCQGPKYFSKGGVSLYKLKESFLGGKKK